MEQGRAPSIPFEVLAAVCDFEAAAAVITARRLQRRHGPAVHVVHGLHRVQAAGTGPSTASAGITANIAGDRRAARCVGAGTSAALEGGHGEDHSGDRARLCGQSDQKAWQRAHEHDLASFGTMSDLQEARPARLPVREAEA